MRRTRTFQIQCSQGAVGFKRLDQRLCDRVFNLVVCDRTQSARCLKTHTHSTATYHQPTPATTTVHSGKRTAELQRRQGAVGLQGLGKCLCTRNANLVACNRSPSASWTTPSPQDKKAPPQQEQRMSQINAVENAQQRTSVVRERLDSSALASACVPTTSILLSVTARTQYGVSPTHCRASAGAVGHAHLRSSVVRVVFDSSALARA
jgi:hypothetical protein